MELPIRARHQNDETEAGVGVRAVSGARVLGMTVKYETTPNPNPDPDPNPNPDPDPGPSPSLGPSPNPNPDPSPNLTQVRDQAAAGGH